MQYAWALKWRLGLEVAPESRVWVYVCILGPLDLAPTDLGRTRMEVNFARLFPKDPQRLRHQLLAHAAHDGGQHAIRPLHHGSLADYKRPGFGFGVPFKQACGDALEGHGEATGLDYRALLEEYDPAPTE